MKNKKVLATVIVMLLGTTMCISGCNDSEEYTSETKDVIEAEDPVVEVTDQADQADEAVGLEFPYAVPGTSMTIESLSQASVPNPDADGSLIDNIACIEVQNNGETYISNVEFTLKMMNDTEFTFIITDLPAGSFVQAFDVNNTVYDGKLGCDDVTAENLTEADGNQLMENEIQVQVDETIVTLTNITNDTLENLSVVCHCDLGDSYFGGCSYTYPVDSISAGGSIEIDASDCYLGQASVVRIYRNN